MQRHVAAGLDHAAGALGKRAAKGLHPQIVAHHQAGQSDPISNHFAHYNGRDAGRSPVVVDRQEHMGGHGQRRIAQRPERAEIDRIELGLGDVDARQRKMAVGLGPAVSGHVLDHRQHAAGEAALHHGAAQLDHHLWIAREGAVADDLMRALLRHVEHRRAIDIDVERVKFLRDQPGAGEGGLLSPARDRSRRDVHSSAPAAWPANAAAAAAARARLPGRSAPAPRRFRPHP